VIGALGAQALGGDGRLSEALALSSAGGHAQGLLAPDPLDALSVEGPSLVDELRVRSAVAPSRALSRELAQPGAQGGVLGRSGGLVALGRAVPPSTSHFAADQSWLD
jgi:hypothetical protein